MIEAEVQIGKFTYNLDDILDSLIHVRGFNLCSSYCIFEISHSMPEIVFEFMNYSTIKFRYSINSNDSGWIEMAVLMPKSDISLSHVKSKVIAIEKGFVNLSSKQNIKAFPKQSISDVIKNLASNANISYDIKDTRGVYTYLQTNMTDLQFIVQYLQPLAITSSNESPYLFTIDKNKLIFKPAELKQEPFKSYPLISNIETVIKKLTVYNRGSMADYMSGTRNVSYGYDPINLGLLIKELSMTNTEPESLNNILYNSMYSRTNILPYSEKWMVEAHSRFLLGMSKFIVGAYAIVEGDIDYNPGQINEFKIPHLSGDIGEYSGKYFTSDVINIIKRNSFMSHLKLVGNAFYQGEQV